MNDDDVMTLDALADLQRARADVVPTRSAPANPFALPTAITQQCACGAAFVAINPAHRTCFDCLRKVEDREASTEALRATLATIPEGYRSAKLETGKIVAGAAEISRGTTLASLPLRGQRPIVFVGPAGAGKTTLAVAMLKAWSRITGGEGRFVHAYRLGVARIQHSAGDGEPRAVEEAMTAPLLLLDDVGAERQTQTNAVADVIFERHAEGRPTWITTGLGTTTSETADAIAKMYGDGIARRTFERAQVFQLGGRK